MRTCPICEKVFENNHSLPGHIVHCRNSGKEKIKQKRKPRRTPRHYCLHCDKYFENPLALGGHQTHCSLNPKKQEIERKAANSNKGKNHTEETKNKISKSRIKYLLEHPDQVPYLLNHSSKKSWPEQHFEEALNRNNITGWVYNFQHNLYAYDFGFPELKIDVEIDGGTHLLEKVIKGDAVRDLFSISQGWRVLRFPTQRIQKNVQECIEELKNFMTPG